ncbi:rhamnosyltransferase [Caudovirales GX15bay]|nr:rhamnosyltransferase [Caudovirales GX15bay]
MIRADLITIFHNEVNHQQHETLLADLRRHEYGFRFLAVDNRANNRGFAAGCNLAAFHPKATAPIIGFLNPDVAVAGPFLEVVRGVLDDTTVITGCRFGKPQRELSIWGVHDWVCGAALFVDRAWFRKAGGFDTRFVWSHEETDLIRRAQQDGRRCRSISLPISHKSPETDAPRDVAYKRHHFAKAQRLYIKKWGSG